ncbi:hypothetical protein CR513_15757, partial [Mucuna pruriens]
MSSSALGNKNLTHPKEVGSSNPATPGICVNQLSLNKQNAKVLLAHAVNLDNYHVIDVWGCHVVPMCNRLLIQSLVRDLPYPFLVSGVPFKTPVVAPIRIELILVSPLGLVESVLTLHSRFCPWDGSGSNSQTKIYSTKFAPSRFRLRQTKWGLKMRALLVSQDLDQTSGGDKMVVGKSIADHIDDFNKKSRRGILEDNTKATRRTTLRGKTLLGVDIPREVKLPRLGLIDWFELLITSNVEHQHEE